MRRPWVLVASLLGAALRLAGIDAKGFWSDERLTVLILRDGFLDVLPRVAHDTHPPLHSHAGQRLNRATGPGYRAETRSTTNTSVSFGPMAGGEPCAP